ncbi:ArsR family transcriptional regulator [Actinoplanes cyaneus]|uniref:ArsR family transcriptional regulator n=2 Tax=Actinoplanes cyaneus TaxID=52696 RepID=A0A919INL7_9ACTN|nr:HTH domain-containing protein [Actinoplanes cyaneus]GID68326.1 ArsR family transcriptional regulator [Actinoplanes cyaneus]
MQRPRSQLLPLLRSPFLGELLAWLYLHPETDYSVTELAEILRVSTSTVSREAGHLAKVGLLIETRRGNLRLLRAATDHRLARPLTELLALTYGPAAVLGDVLRSLDGVEEAYIYGSWAARYAGEPGPPPRDVDVLVVGDVDEDDLADRARVAERRLGREVNAHRVSVDAWRSSGEDPFLGSVRSRPLYTIGDGDEVAAGP